MKNTEEMIVFYGNLGSRIQKKRNLKEISQEQLADIVGLSPITIHNIETGETKTSAYNFYRIAQALNVSMLDLVYDDFSEGDELLQEYFLKVASLDLGKKEFMTATIKHLLEEIEKL